mgnify:CR=1 FL=1
MVERQVQNEIAQTFKEGRQPRRAPPTPPEGKEWLTRLELCEYAHISKATVTRWVASGKLRKYKVSTRIVRYRREDVDVILWGEVEE